MTAAYEINQTIQIGRIAYVLRRQGAALDERSDQDTVLGVNHGGTKSGCVCRKAGGEFMRPDNAVHWNVAAETRDKSLAMAFDDEILVGEATVKWTDTN